MPEGPMTEERMTFLSESNRLEGILAYPDEEAPKSALLFLSPHPHMGGNMDNNVIEHLSHRFAEEGHLTLRFNYRGVGNSEIQLPDSTLLFDYWAALEEEERYGELMPDVREAYRELLQCMPPQSPVMIVGYSLGTILALRLLLEETPTKCIVIAPPNKKRALPEASDIHVPLYCIGGEQDFAFDPECMSEWLSDVPAATHLSCLPDGDHFFRLQEEDLFRRIYSLVNTHA